MAESILAGVCLLFSAGHTQAQQYKRVNIAPPVEVRRQQLYNTYRPMQTEHAEDFVQQADDYLRDQVRFIPESAECAAFHLTVGPTFSQYFRRTSVGPFPTKCDGSIGEWMRAQMKIDYAAYEIFYLNVRTWWWENEMPAIAAAYGYSPVELAVWFEDTIRLLWHDRVANRNMRELRKIAEPYLSDMYAGRVMPSWLTDGQLNARSHIAK